MNSCISIDRILEKLDGYLNKNDYASAERHLIYWVSEAEAAGDVRVELTLRNELMGLYRKTGKREQALECVRIALGKIEKAGAGDTAFAATTYLNSATVYKAFSMAEQGVELFNKAREIYERELDKNDARLGGLYNNMGLALVDLKRFDEAKELYGAAISIMEKQERGELEVAITYLNLATAAEAELGLEGADGQIQEYLSIAENLLEGHKIRDGYYAFVCDKCASVFGYYGHFIYEKELYRRAKAIYEDQRT